MRWLSMVALAMTFAVPDRPAPDPPIRNNPALLDGVWAVVAYEYDGGRHTPEQLSAYPNLIVKAGTYRWSNAESGGQMKIDSTKSPPTVDYTSPEGVHLGIFEIQGDTFRDCMARPGKERPREFTVPPGSGHVLMVYRRVRNGDDSSNR